eukprot:s676_g1.t1
MPIDAIPPPPTPTERTNHRTTPSQEQPDIEPEGNESKSVELVDVNNDTPSPDVAEESPPVASSSNPVEVPIPTGDSDDELLAECPDCFALPSDECWKLEIDLTERDIDQWKKEVCPSHMAFAATAAKRQRSEVKLSQLSEHERQLFQQAKAKEIDS